MQNDEYFGKLKIENGKLKIKLEIRDAGLSEYGIIVWEGAYAT